MIRRGFLGGISASAGFGVVILAAAAVAAAAVAAAAGCRALTAPT
jgi:hypothetical protein